MGELIRTDEELAEVETEVETVIEPPEADLESEFELEIVDAAHYGDIKSEALIEAEAKIAEYERQKLTDNSSAGRDEALAASMASIKAMQDQLASGIKVEGPAQTQAAPSFDMDAHRASYNKNLYNDPAKQTEAFMAPYLMELNGKIDKVNSASARNSSKAELLMVDDSREFYSQYRDEIENLATKLDASPDVYQKALSAVKSNHLDDIIAEKVAAKLAEAQIPAGPKPPPTNVGQTSAPAIKTKRQVTPGMQQWLKAARMKGIGDEKWLLERVKDLKASGYIQN